MAKIKLIKIFEHADKPIVCYSGFEFGNVATKLLDKPFERSKLSDRLKEALKGAIVAGFGLFGIEYSYYYQTDNGVAFSTGMTAAGLKTMFKAVIGNSLSGLGWQDETQLEPEDIYDGYDEMLDEGLNLPQLTESAITTQITPVVSDSDESYTDTADYDQEPVDVNYEEVYEID